MHDIIPKLSDIHLSQYGKYGWQPPESTIKDESIRDLGKLEVVQINSPSKFLYPFSHEGFICN